MRLAICMNDTFEAVGLIDLFDFDPKNNRAGVGIVISSESNRNSGIGSEALHLVINYAFNQLQLHQLYANIGSDNEISLQLFTKFGFQKIGIKKDWNKINNSYEDEILYQLINHI
jgi:diamine N-acetyltransferase